MRKFLLASFLTLFSFISFAQSDIGNIVKGSNADANYLVNGYVAPALSVIGYGLNQGWYNTAKPHKILGFDLTATVSFIKIPTSDLSYYVDNTKLTYIERLNGPKGSIQSGYVPTVFGSSQSPSYTFKPYVPGVTEFNGAPGADLSSVPVIKNSLPIPMAQLGIGLPKGFELKVRYIPTIKFGNNSSSNFGLFGIGLMHDVKQYLPGIKELPFDLSGFIGYTKMTMNVSFDPQNPQYNQNGVLTSSATTIQGVISKKFSVLTGYAGLGYNIATTKMAISGNYDIKNTGTPTTPISINTSAASNGPRATFGLRLKLAVFNFHGEYTLQKYSSLTLGFGISVR